MNDAGRLAATPTPPIMQLFPDKRAAKGIRELRRILGSQHKTASFECLKRAREAIRIAVRKYWADKRHDNQESYGVAKAQLRLFRPKLDSFIEALEALPLTTRHIINIDHTRRIRARSKISLSETTRDNLESIRDTIDYISAPIYAGLPDTALKCLCKDLIKIREILTGNAFLHSWRRAKGKGDDLEYVAADARFVQVAVQAIDSGVEPKTLRSTLKQMRKQKVTGKL